MSQDYTVAKELASLKEIKQSAEQRTSELSLNALNYVNDHRLHKSGGGGGSSPFKTAELTLNKIDDIGQSLAWYGTYKSSGHKTVYVRNKPNSTLFDDSKLVVPFDVVFEYEESRGTMPSLFSVEGDAELFDYPDDQMFSIYITGDCVITYTGDGNWPKVM